MQYDSKLLEQHIRFILQTHMQGKFKENIEFFNFGCNICGEGKSKGRKRRAYIFKNKQPLVFYCHNCNASTTALNWMKIYYPQTFKDFLSDNLLNKKPIEVPLKKEESYDEKKDIKFFVSILKGSGEIFERAKNYCNERLISESIWNKWYVATDGKFKNRLVIPYFDNNGKIYNWQARSLLKQTPKYISRIAEGYKQYNNIYNFYNVNREDPVIIFEGVINSLFVENSVAIGGLKRTKSNNIQSFPERYFIVDADKSGYNKSLELLEIGEYVFMWKNFIKDYNLPQRDKWDFNDVNIYLNKKEAWKFSELKKYFSNSIFNQIYFL